MIIGHIIAASLFAIDMIIGFVAIVIMNNDDYFD